MTIGTATVASTNVRTTGVMVPSQPARARLRAVSVGKTQSQIIRASWCRLGGAGASSAEGMRFLSRVDVVLEELGVDGDRDRGAFAGGGDDLSPRVGGVARRPDARHAGAAIGVGSQEPVGEELAAEGCAWTVRVGAQ